MVGAVEAHSEREQMDKGQPASGSARPRRRVAGPRPRHVPQRTCVACRQVLPKRELVRVVRGPAGVVAVDETGKRNGRGAYLHAQRTCWERALQQRSLQHALKIEELREQDLTALEAYLTRLPADGGAAASDAPSHPRVLPEGGEQRR